MKKSAKNYFKRIRLSYKICLISAAIALIINVLSVFFVLMPIYSLVGENDQSSTENDITLSRAENTTEVAMVVTYVLIGVSFASGSYGAYQDVRKKSKK
jgi:hypothetical protein